MEILIEFFAKGLMTMLMIAMPCVLTAAVIGLIVGILQAVTQVQEQTIATAPKIFAVFLVIIILGTGYLKMLTNLFEEGSNIAFEVVPKTDDYVLPNNYYNYTKPFLDEMKKDIRKDTTSIAEILNKTTTPQSMTEQERYNYIRNRGNEIPTPNLAERKKIMENKR